MRKVELRMNEEYKYKIIKKLLETNRNKKRAAIELYISKYWDCNYRFFSELLNKHENINVSESTVRKILIDEYLISPKCQRKTKCSYLL